VHLLIVGGSDAGISAGLRARELAPDTDVTLIVADAYPNFSICGIPYHVSGDVRDWRSLAHRSIDQIAGSGARLRLNERAVAVDVAGHTVTTQGRNGTS
jgi:NADPH-dependent 2,4-dienoyl-CoA reductase/sulfur reductase-like enzyme